MDEQPTPATDPITAAINELRDAKLEHATQCERHAALVVAIKARLYDQAGPFLCHDDPRLQKAVHDDLDFQISADLCRITWKTLNAADAEYLKAANQR